MNIAGIAPLSIPIRIALPGKNLAQAVLDVRSYRASRLRAQHRPPPTTMFDAYFKYASQ